MNNSIDKNSYNVGTVQNMQDAAQNDKDKIKYSLIDAIFFVLFIVVGGLYIKYILIGGMKGFSVISGFMLPFVALSFLYFYFSKIKISKRAKMFGILTLLLSLPFALYESLPPFSALIVHISGAYTIFLLGRPDIIKADSNFIFDVFSSLIIKPFSCFFRCIGSLGGFVSTKAKKSNVLYVVLGLCIGFPAFLITLSLLSRADSGFNGIWEKLFEFLGKINLFEHYGFPFPSILVSLYLFGALFCSKFGICKNVFNSNSVEKAKNSFKIAPKQVIFSAALPVLALYVIFFAIQFYYVFGAFAKVLPQGFTYSGYARKGFFELCMLAVINIGFIIAMESFAKSDNVQNKCPKSVKLLSCVVCVFTLLLIFAAIAKLVMYISIYGFTPNRIYPTVFLVFLVFLFGFMIVKRLKESFDFVRAVTVVAITFLLLVMYTNIPYLCIRGNLMMSQSTEDLLDGGDTLYTRYASSTVLALEKHGMLDIAPQLVRSGRLQYISNSTPALSHTAEFIKACNTLKNNQELLK